MSDHLYEGSSSRYATARKGGLCRDQIDEIRAYRQLPRPIPYRVLADMYSVCELDILKMLQAEPEVAAPPAPQPVKTQKAHLLEAKRRNVVPTFWTEDRDAELRRLYLERTMSSTQIADAIGATLFAVYARAARLSLRRPDGKTYAIFNQQQKA